MSMKVAIFARRISLVKFALALSISIYQRGRTWSSFVSKDVGLNLPKCQTNLAIALHEVLYIILSIHKHNNFPLW